MTAPDADPISADQVRQNLTTRNQWQLYASHRAEIEKLIVPESRGQRICVLGAGNCNDLDLKWLSEVYGEVHLVDLDRRALLEAVKRQGVEPLRGTILGHAPIDLTGIASQVADWQKAPPTLAQIDEATRILLQPPQFPWPE